jgi:dihydroorotate dehydrogenase (NAD+) catalytic subunit
VGMKPGDVRVRIGPLELANPVGVASGTFGYGSEYEALIDLSRLGALYTKAVTLSPRAGNPPPRLVETRSGILNSIGLANPGVEAFIAQKLPECARYGCAIVVNVAGASEDEYRFVVERLEEAEGIAAYEINVSCPNVCHGGLAFGTDPVQVERLTGSLRKVSRRPIIVKLSPNVTDIASIAKAAEAGGADAVSCINTLVGMEIDIKSKKPVIPAGTAGLSGPAIRPVGVACVYKASRAVRIPVIGLGGIIEPSDAIQYLLAGASAVQVGTGIFVDPGIPLRVLEGIEDYMAANGFSSIADFHGLF